MKTRILSFSLIIAILAVCLAAAPAGQSSAALPPVADLTPHLQPAPTAAQPEPDTPAPAMTAENLLRADTESADDTAGLADSEGLFVETASAAIHPFCFGTDIITEVGRISARFLREQHQPKGGIIRDDGVFQGKVLKGDTLSGVLEQAARGSVRNYVEAARKVFPLRSFREGQPYIVYTEPQSGALTRFEYEINDSRRLVVEGAASPRARLEKIEYQTKLEALEGTIADNLFQTVADIGESPQLALRLVDLFGSEINFIRDLQEGDSFTVLIEKRYRDGDYKGYGRILAATFSNRQKTYYAYLFGDGTEPARYFNQRGESLKKTLLQSPLAFTRMTSKFTHSRKHPILGKTRPHLGVDYAAPTGTPVKSVGDGTVTRRGWAGGYGNQIIVKHAAGLESMYAHLSGFARGLRQGQKVRQGQVIGYVGSTGLSTGPHLDFRLRQKGKFINPAKAINPRGAGVPAKNMAAFKKVMALEKKYLDGRQPPVAYVVDSIVPSGVSVKSTKVARMEKKAPARRVTKKRSTAQNSRRRASR